MTIYLMLHFYSALPEIYKHMTRYHIVEKSTQFYDKLETINLAMYTFRILREKTS